MRAFQKIALVAALLISAPAVAQVKQSGTVTPGHVASWTTNGIIQDGGTSGAGVLNNLGITASGTPFCINDAVVSGQYHQLCLGANSLGGGLLSYTANGGASTLPFQFNFNGNAIIFSGGSLTLGTNGSQQGSLLIEGLTSGTVTLTTAAIAGTYNFILPNTAGTANQPLVSGGGGSTAMSWGSLTGNTSIFVTGSGSFTTGHCAVFDASGNLVDNGSGCGGSGTVNPGTIGQFSYYASTTNAVSGTSLIALSGSTLTVTGALAVTPSNQPVTLSPTGTGTVTIAPSTAGTINNVAIGTVTPTTGAFTTASATTVLSAGSAGVSLGSINVSGNSSGTVTIKPQAAAGTYNFNLPSTAGTTGQPLISGGGGATAMSFGSLSGNTSSFATTNGALVNGHCVSIDSSGNFQDSGSACATGSGTVNSGTSGQLTYYASSTNAVSGNADANISGGALTLGVANSVIGKLLVTGSSSGTITIQPQAASGTYNFNLPITAGTSGQPLLSAGGGASPMVYGSLSGNTTAFATKSGSWTTGNCVAVDASGNLVDNGTPCGSGGSGTVVSSTAGQLAYYPTTNTVVAGNPSITASAGAVTFGVATSIQGQLKLSGATSGLITVTGQAASGTYEFDLPTTAGTSGQVLTSAGGAGSPMTWTTPGITWGGAPKTVNFNGTSNTRYCIDTATTGAVTMTLPGSPSDGDQIGFIDCKSNFAVTSFTVARNGNKIMGLTSDMTVNTANAASTLIYSSTLSDWRIY